MKEQIIFTATCLGLYLDLDKWEDKGFMRFEHPDKDLDEPDLRFVAFKEESLEYNLKSLGEIIFGLGEKNVRNQIQKSLGLCKNN